jgi:Lrp/AsnC family transcriptional regulator for asnA, asnC and gidA
MPMGRNLDAIDEEIIRHLQRDGRATNREIARRIGVSEGTVRNRIERLTEDHVIRIAAIVNPVKVGLHTSAVMNFQVEPTQLTDVANRLASVRDLTYIGYATGTSDLICLGQFKDNDALFRFLTETVSQVPGVRKVDTSIILRNVRRLFTSPDVEEEPLTPATPAG